jgi:hypothetical protein
MLLAIGYAPIKSAMLMGQVTTGRIFCSVERRIVYLGRAKGQQVFEIKKINRDSNRCTGC